MTLVTPPSGPDFDVTDYEALAYYRREPGYVVHDGVSGPASTAPTLPLWAASTSYKAGQEIWISAGTVAVAQSTHLSGSTYAADKTAGKWVEVAGGGTSSAVTYPDGTTSTTVAPRTYEFDVRDYGAKADAVGAKDGAITTGTPNFSSASASFVAGDVGKTIIVSMGAGHLPLATTIAARVSATQVTLSANATQTVSGNAVYFYGTNDTTAVQNAVNAAQAVKGVARLHPTGLSLTTAAISVTNHVAIEGAGCRVSQGSIGAIWDSINSPVSPPYFVGSGLVVAATGVNAITISGTAALSVNLKGFGIVFGGVFNNTGHGIQYIPPTYLTGKDNGLFGATWDNVQVFGHDGDHYGMYLVNPILNTITHFRAYGGGCIYLENNSAASPSGFYGNTVFNHPYGMLMVFGTAHGIYLHSAAQNLYFVTMIRPQVNVGPATTTFPASSTPLTQKCVLDDGTQYLTMLAPDMEGAAATYAQATGFANINGYTGGAPTDSEVLLRPTQGGPGLSALMTRLNPKTYTGIAARPDPMTYGIGGGPIFDTAYKLGGAPLYSDTSFGYGGVGGDWRDGSGTVAFLAGTPGGAGTAPGSVAGGPLNWWDASALALADNASVTSVASTGSGANALACTGVKYVNGVVNGKGALRFDGSNSTRGDSTFTLAQPFTFFIVFKGVLYDTVSGQHDVLMDGKTGDTDVEVWQGGTQLWAGGTSLVAASTTGQRQWAILTGIFNGASSLIRRNGTQIAAAGATVGANTPGGITVGNSRALGRGVRADVAEVIVYNSALSGANMLAVEQWLGTKYALTTA